MSLRARLYQGYKKTKRPLFVYNEITISRSAILYNFDFFQKLHPNGYAIPVLKSNAYGHGIEQITEILRARSFPYIAVDGYYEADVVHRVSNQPVLVMGAIHPSNFEKISFKRVAFVVHDLQIIKALSKQKRRVKIHLELETGMSRHGIPINDLPRYLSILKTAPQIEVEGVMSHLADADNPDSQDYVQTQVERYDAAVEKVLKAGFHPKYFHIANTGGSIKARSKYANTIRLGIGLYGLNPLEKADPFHKVLEQLKPALTLTSTVTKILALKKGDTVSYNRTYKVKKATHIAVLPLGYYEGVPRQLSNIGKVQYVDRYFSVAGRVTMNHTMVDIGDETVEVGDRMTLISANKRSRVSVTKLPDRFGLFSYSFVTGINQNIRRRIVD